MEGEARMRKKQHKRPAPADEALNFCIEDGELVVYVERDGRIVAGPLKAWTMLGGKPSDYKMISIGLRRLARDHACPMWNPVCNNMEKTPMTVHPLADVVLAAFTPERPQHDTRSLAYHLAGGNDLRSMTAYLTVTQDVLDCMERSGLVYHDKQWRYRLTERANEAKQVR
jgi:hypothetical protein